PRGRKAVGSEPSLSCRAQLGRPPSGLRARADIERLYPQRIADEDDLLGALVHENECEDPVQPSKEPVAPFLPPVYEDFGVRPRAEPVARSLELAPKLELVINLAVEGHPDGSVLIRHGLSASVNIDDAEAAVSQHELRRAGEVLSSTE